ncbi:MAG: hypothetical protein ACRDNS_03735 [Trebonia sp.]
MSIKSIGGNTPSISLDPPDSRAQAASKALNATTMIGIGLNRRDCTDEILPPNLPEPGSPDT